PAVAITNVLLDGYTGIPATGSDDGEEALDIQMSMCMAPGATILVYEGNSALDIYNRMATDNKAKQMSCSFGFSPPPATMDQVFQQYAMQGQTMFQASGDNGANAGPLFPPFDDPNITAVGGTSLTTSGAGGPWLSETAWRGSGGGVSTTYSIPSWQLGIDMTANQGSTTMRNVPDVSILADTIIFTVNKNGQTGGIGGTSAAAPMWAGFMALVNQQAAANGKPPIGFFNPIIYSLGKGPNRNTILHDITTGNTTNSSSPTKFFAVPGYDLCTGWGSPNGPNMINTLAGPNDALQIQPGIGFNVAVPHGVPASPTALNLSLTNTGAASLDWVLTNSASWLDVSATNGTLTPGGAAGTVTVSLDTSVASTLAVGIYTANVWITNLTSGVAQSRLFILNVSTADFPIAVTGFNAGVIVPNNATPLSPQATGFDIANNIAFYEAGLNGNPLVSGSGGAQGLPQNGLITSQADGATTFQLGPYGGANALMLGDTYASSGTLTLANPKAYNSLAVLAASANGGGVGTLVVHFTNGTSSQIFNFNAQDWFGTTANVAIKGFGRLYLNSGLFTEDDGANNPNLYQTIINLAPFGFNQAVASVTFTKPPVGGSQDSGVFALSGALMPPQVNITQQPRSATNNIPGTSSTLSVVAMGSPPLFYQWFSTNMITHMVTGLTNQTNASLVFNPAVSSDTGVYFVVVSNAFNAVPSSPATLTVYTKPVITQQPSPTNLFLYPGGGASLSVAAIGAAPFYYAWNYNGAPIAGATSPQHTLNNVQPADSGNYTATVSNSFGVTTSSIVSLTVIARPNRTYPETVLADKPIGYWRLDEASGTTAYDRLGGNNGHYFQVALGKPGYNPLDPDTAGGFGILSPANSYVGTIPMDFATAGNATFSVEAWVNGAAQTADGGIISKGTGWGGEQFDLDTGSDGSLPHAFRFFVR
ncbi:MAG TPA: immunoglobulin domain-containing protein, partial [Verrucomicrobiae bacterium]|nr:immunoglobulin domain-containing protein [Verrucomicrobiae bacterium]